jgi:murein DD-endopeptidase MepM/ murein hydrolase activator NlpD
VAGGLHGRQAVEAIVRRFERPADPSGEVARASGMLGQFGGGSEPIAAGHAASPPGAAPSAPDTALRTMLLRYLQNRDQRPNWLQLAAQQHPTPTLESRGAPVGGAQQDPLQQAIQTLLARRAAFASKKPLFPPEPDIPGLSRSDVAALGGAGQKAWGRSLNGRSDAVVLGKIIGVPHQGTHTLGNWESDNAIDIALPKGTPIYAPASGTIGSQFGSLGKGGRFAGLRLHLISPGNEFYLAHLSRFAPGIQPGARVKAGQLIGYSGVANGVEHLHIGARKGDPRKALGLA